jgi:hypothetical protein
MREHRALAGSQRRRKDQVGAECRFEPVLSGELGTSGPYLRELPAALPRLIRLPAGSLRRTRQRTPLKLPLPFSDLVRMHIELLCQFGQCAFTPNRCECHLALNAAECVRRVLFVIFWFPLPALCQAQIPAVPLIALTEFPAPPVIEM